MHRAQAESSLTVVIIGAAVGLMLVEAECPPERLLITVDGACVRPVPAPTDLNAMKYPLPPKPDLLQRMRLESRSRILLGRGLMMSVLQAVIMSHW